MRNATQEEIITKYQVLAYGIARQFRNRGLDWDDLKQESLIGLLKAHQNYDPEIGTEFSTYATYWIKKQLHEAAKQSCKTESLSEPQLTRLSDQSADSISQDLSLPEDMPELEKKILHLSYVQQLSLKEMAKLLNLSVERVNQTRKKALRRLKVSSQIHPLSDV